MRSLTSAHIENQIHIWSISLHLVVYLVQQLENLIEVQNQVRLIHHDIKQFRTFTFL